MMGTLNVSAADSIWILISFQIALVAVLLPCSALADCLGYRTLFLSGSVIFIGGSLGCAVAQDLLQICAARTLQGLGAAAIYSTNPSLVRLIFTGERLRRGIALSSMTNAMSMALGPLLGSLMISLGSWRLIFLINLPLGLLGLCIGIRHLPSSRFQQRPALRQALDPVSLLLSIVFLPLFVIGGDRLVFDPAWGVVLVVAGLLTGTALFLRQRGRVYQLLPVSLFRDPVFALSLTCSIFAFLALMAAYTSLPFMFHLSPRLLRVPAAVCMMVPPLMTAVGNAMVLPLSRRCSEVQLCSLGMLLMAGGLVGLGTDPQGKVMLLASLAALGLGFGLFQTPNNRMILGAADPTCSGNVSGTLALVRTLGQTSGSSVVSVSLAVWGMAGSQHALLIAASFAVACALIGFMRQRSVAP